MRSLIGKICRAFELGDHEYIRGSFHVGYPFSAWLTILEPRRRIGWRKALPWRVRFQWAGFLLNVLYRNCTVCGNKFTAHELLRRPSGLTYFPSGSICHNNCTRRAA